MAFSTESQLECEGSPDKVSLMRIFRKAVPFVTAALLVSAVAWLPGFSAEAAPSSSSNDHTRGLDHERPIRPSKHAFFGLKVNSMDVEGDARTLACYEYVCPGILPNDQPHRYQFVRHAYRNAGLNALLCDEILPIAFVGHTVTYSADVLTSRWMRRRGPSGTPIGGFVGKLYVNATVTVGNDVERTVRIPFLDINLIGTTGLRPGRSTNAVDSRTVVDRCNAPLHDEGYYQGVFHRKGLRVIERLVRPDSAAHIRILRRLAGSVIAGTFEGRLSLPQGVADTADYCDLTTARWWFDGLLGYRCRKIAPDPRVKQEREPSEDRFQNTK